MTYDEKYPVGKQTVVKIRDNIFQVNTKKATGWYVSKNLYIQEVAKELQEQKLKLDTYYDRKQR